MRLDKFMSACGLLSRTETNKAVRAGRIFVNGTAAKKADMQINENTDAVLLDGKAVTYKQFVYFLLNKPQGLVSATEDGNDETVISLFPPEIRKMGIFPCGRLDKNTTGLMLITNDGALSHKLLAPKSHVAKTYAFTVKFPLSEADAEELMRGVDIGGYVTKPCTVQRREEKEGTITIIEGKYHQIKFMMEAVHNQIRSLERISFGPLTLPENLAAGEWRELTEAEVHSLTHYAEHN